MRRLPLRSPPRMRGKGPQHLPPALQNGITPAYAGESFGSFCFLSFRQDHPRVCGEKQAAVALPQPVLGSPPRMRGKACLTLIIRLLLGITPAHAGKSLPAVLKCPPTRDHPRVCGEKRRVRSWRALLLGSPPRMRGKVVLSSENPLCRGITPAYAGKSRSSARPHHSHRDHPRACGEKTEYRALVTAHQGSPPRMRGKAVPKEPCQSNRRDHPRVCGEKTIYRIIKVACQGSPPRMRGKAVQPCRILPWSGITPAYAGKRSETLKT